MLIGQGRGLDKQWPPAAPFCACVPYYKIITRPCSVISSSPLARSSADVVSPPPPLTNRCIQVCTCVGDHLKGPLWRRGRCCYLRPRYHLTFKINLGALRSDGKSIILPPPIYFFCARQPNTSIGFSDEG